MIIRRIMFKKDKAFFHAERGEEFTVTFRQPLDQDDAEKRAWRILQRDRPSSNMMEWSISQVS